MQAGKSAVETAKETVANIAASAKSGMEKTIAVIEEKVDIISTSDQVEKDMATLKKEDRIRQAELLKQQAYSQNAAAAAGGTESYTAVGTITHAESHSPTGTESYPGTGLSETKPMSHVTTDGVHDAGTTVTVGAESAVGTKTETTGGGTPVRTGPEP